MTIRTKKRIRDPLPGGIKYRDAGCELAPSCLNCPLAVCKHDLGNTKFISEVYRERERTYGERATGTSCISGVVNARRAAGG